MKQTIDFYAFRDAFRACGRTDQFSPEGLRALFDHCEECDPDWELDVIGLCCDYYEDTPEAIADNYSIDLSECEDDDDKIDAVRDYLEYHTVLVGQTSAGFVYAAF